MRRFVTFSLVLRLAALTAALAAVLPLAGAGHPARTVTANGESWGAAPGVPRVRDQDAAVTSGQRAGTAGYWTRRRMEQAVPLAAPLATPKSKRAKPTPAPADPAPAAPAASAPARAEAPAWTAGGAVTRTTGKVFFTLGRENYVCSGAVVDSRHGNVVITAAHCVKNAGGAWATHWTFVPGYDNGSAPYGSYTERRYFVAPRWSKQGDNDDDVAFVTVNPARIGATSVPVQQEVGGQPIAFGRRPARQTAFGYPALSPYGGGALYYCAGKTSRDPFHTTTDRGLPCAMTEGSSGGPWLSGFDPATGTGTITSVSSFKYSAGGSDLFGPQLGATAASLFRQAQASRPSSGR